jgi:hypothetical protein
MPHLGNDFTEFGSAAPLSEKPMNGIERGTTRKSDLAEEAQGVWPRAVVIVGTGNKSRHPILLLAIVIYASLFARPKEKGGLCLFASAPQACWRLDSRHRRSYERSMLRSRKPDSSNPKAIASRSWCASLIRSKAQVLGDVRASSREAAEAAAVRMFNLSPEQRRSLVVQERAKYYE